MLRLAVGALAVPPSAALARVTVADRNAGAVVTTTPSGLQYYDFVTAASSPPASSSSSSSARATMETDSDTTTPISSSPSRANGDDSSASSVTSSTGSSTASAGTVTPSGAAVVSGDDVVVQYTLGTTGARNGWRIESSDEHAPLAFRVGGGAVVRGLDEGVLGMRVGMRRRLIIPPTLGYTGRAGDRPVPTGFAPYQRFKNIYLNPDRPYKPDVVLDVTLMRVAHPR